MNKEVSEVKSLCLNDIPSEMKATKRWVMWKLDPIYEANKIKLDKEGKPKFGKVPYDAKNDQKADSTDLSTWCSFDEAVARFNKGGYEGIGFVLGWDEETGRNFAGVDIDHLESAEDWQRARKVAARFDTYTEVSPSEKGLHIISFGKKEDGPPRSSKEGGPKCKSHNKNVEIYDHARFFTVTGKVLDGKKLPVNSREEVLREFYREIFPDDKRDFKGGDGKVAAAAPVAAPIPSSVASVPVVSPTLSDEEIMFLASNEKEPAGEKFRALYMAGDTSEYGDDDSAADMALMNKLAFYSKDPLQLERLFSGSALARRDKWVKRADYRKSTVDAALRFVKESYTPKGKGRGKKGNKEEKRSLAAVVTDAILQAYTLRTVKETGTILVKEASGGWREIEELELGAIAQGFGGRDKTTPAVLKDVYSKIQHENLISIEDFERRPDLFMDVSGKVFSSLTREVVDISTDEYKDVFVIHKIGAVFDPLAPVPPEFLQAVELILPNKQERLTFQEHVGSGFLRTMKYDKIYSIVGDTRNGKTTLFELVLAVVGKNNVSTISLKQMGLPYHTFKMWRMLFNIMDDISNEALRNTEFFKAWLGGFPVNIMKKYGMPVDTPIYCKGLCGANLLAAAANKNDQGYYSKWILGSAPNTFKLENELSNEERETGILEPNCYHADPDLVEKLTSDPLKLSGILNYFLDGLARLRKNGSYTLRLTKEENRVRYDSMATPLNEVSEFLNMIGKREDMSKETRKADVFKLMGIYLQARKIPPVSMATFNDGLRDVGIGDKDRSRKARDTLPLVALEDAEAVKPAVLRGFTLRKGWEEMLSGWRAIIEMDRESELLED
jgi:hypothetical protein